MNRHVLVVEDEPLIRMDAVSMLEAAGMSVVEFDRADEALAFTKANPATVAGIFTDVNVHGGLDGIDLALEASRVDPSITVVVTSGRYRSRPGILPDAVQFLRKPWMPLQVLTAMQNAMAR